MKESQWRIIPNCNGMYEASTEGQIRSVDRISTNGKPGGYFFRSGKVLQPVPDAKGYLRVCLYINGKAANKKVHRLVAMTFIPNPDVLPQVNHKDGNKSNNHLNNLEWCSNTFNCEHKMKHGLHNCPKGSAAKHSILTETDVMEIKSRHQNHKVTGRALAKEFNVHFSTISKIITGKNWKQL